MKLATCCAAWIICLSVLAAADGPYHVAVPVPNELAVGFDSITEAESREILSVVAGADFAGRGTGQEGYFKAAAWFADRLKENGFQPGGPDGSWFQNVPFIRLAAVADKCRIQVGDATCIEGTAFGATRYAGEFSGDLPVRFVRLSGERPAMNDGELAGQLLVIQASGRLNPSDGWIVRGQPAAVLIVIAADRFRSESVIQQTDPLSTIPTAEISVAAANPLAEQCGVSPSFFAETISGESLSVSSSRKVKVQLTIDREAVDVPNVIGWYPGSDESVRDEYVCVGAHLDHLGVQHGEVYPGADDNGSGSTAVLQIAKAIHSNPVKPRRSVQIMAFCAEERGLLGSRYYVEHPVRPLEQMVCMLNIDMIGRNEQTDSEKAEDNETSIHLVGSKRISEQLHDLTLQANQHVGFDFEYDEERVYTRSDHASFASKGIPITFLFGGFSPFYHKPVDTLEGINFSKIANAARLNYVTLMMASEHGHFERNQPEAE